MEKTNNTKWKVAALIVCFFWPRWQSDMFPAVC